VADPTRKKTTRTLAGLRESLFEAIDALRDGSITQEQARAIAELGKGIITSAALQLDYERAWADKKIGDRLRAVELVPELEHKP